MSIRNKPKKNVTFKDIDPDQENLLQEIIQDIEPDSEYKQKSNIHEVLRADNMKNTKIFQKMTNKLKLSELPDDVIISTITMICQLNTTFICKNIAKYIDLIPDGILSVTHGKAGNIYTNRSIMFKKTSVNKKKKKKKVFFNQVSMYVHVHGKRKKPVNVKLFSNGSIQMTGCKTVSHAIEAMEKIFVQLRKVKALVDYKKNKIIEKPFVTNTESVDINHIKNMRIVMINSNFDMHFHIDRLKLYNLLTQQNYECRFDPINHACVNIKYENDEKAISIFVFEKGSVIITGAKNCSHIKAAYKFINEFLIGNYNEITKNDDFTNSSIVDYMDKLGETYDDSD